MEDLPLVDIQHNILNWGPINPFQKPQGYEAFNFDKGVPQTD